MKIKTLSENTLNSDKVPVRMDAKTIVMVSKEKCEQLPDGTWIKKTPLNVVQFKEDYAASLKRPHLRKVKPTDSETL